MLKQKIQNLIMNTINCDKCTLTSLDDVHFELIVVSDDFKDYSLVKRHQMVYKAIGDLINSKELHALSMKLYTIEQWKNSIG